MPLVHKTQSLCSEYFHPAATGNIPLLWPFFHLGWFSSLHCPHKFSQEGNLCRFPVSDDRVQVCHNRLKDLYFPVCTSEDQAFRLRGRSGFRMDFQYKYSSHPHKISITAHLMLVPCCSQIILSVWSVPVSGFLPHAEADCRCSLYLYR